MTILVSTCVCERANERRSERRKNSMAHTSKSNLLLWSRKSKSSSNSGTLLPNRSTDMMCCAVPESEEERHWKRERERREGKMRMRTSARASKTYYFYKLTSLHDHRPNTDLHKQTTDSSSVQLRWGRSECNVFSSSYLDRFGIGSHLFQPTREGERAKKVIRSGDTFQFTSWTNEKTSTSFSTPMISIAPYRTERWKKNEFSFFCFSSPSRFFLSLSLSLFPCVLLFCLPIHGLAWGVHPPRLRSLEFFFVCMWVCEVGDIERRIDSEREKKLERDGLVRA